MKAKQTLPLLLLPLIWGGYYVASQQAVERMSVFSAGVLIRFFTMILLGIMMIKRRQAGLLFRTGKMARRLLLIGLLGFLLDLTAFIGLSLSPAGSGTALLKCDILFVNLISVIIYKERFTKRDWIDTFVMLAGVFMIMGVNPFRFRFEGLGDIFFILSAFFVSVNAFLIKSVQLNKEVPIEDNVIAFYNNFITMIFFLAASFIMGTFGQITGAKSFSAFIPAVLAGIGQTLIYVVYYYDLRRYSVWVVKIFLLLMPIVSAFISFVLFDEKLQRGQYLGIVIVLAGGCGILVEQKRKAGSPAKSGGVKT